MKGWILSRWPQVCYDAVDIWVNVQYHWLHLSINYTKSGKNSPDNFGNIFTNKSIIWKKFEGEMFIRSKHNNFPSNIFKLLLNSQVIFISMREADDTLMWNTIDCTCQSITLRVAKTAQTILIILLNKSIFWKKFEGEMFIRRHATTLVQTFCKFLLNSQVIFKSMRVAEYTF